MNADELREVAERLRTNANAEYTKMSPLLYFADCETLAKAYLAELETGDCTDAARPSYWRGNDDGFRSAYVQVSVVGGATIRGYDSWLTPWSGLSGIVEQHMEDNENAVLEFKVIHMTEQELENYCEENGVAWGES